MKYTTTQYAESLWSVLKDCPAKEHKNIIKRFLSVVLRHGNSSELELILRAFEKEYLRKNKLHKVDIEMACSVPEKIKKEIKNILGKDIFFSERENMELGAGIRMIVDGELLIDASAKRKIEEMLRN